MTTMNRAATQRRDAAQELLERLPVAVFRHDEQSQKLSSLNAAARDLAATTGISAISATLSAFEWKHDGCTAAQVITLGAKHYAVNFAPTDEENSRARVLTIVPLVGTSALEWRGDALDDAFHDPLTRLPNRRLFQKRLERAIERAATSSYKFAVLFVDLDRFKGVNDRFGHVVGDKMLVAAAQRLLMSVRPQDMVARRDGDEFTVLLDDLSKPADAEQIAERICESMRKPLNVAGEMAAVGASVGIVISSDGEFSAEALIAAADAAMYHAKALGGGTFVAIPKPRPR